MRVKARKKKAEGNLALRRLGEVREFFDGEFNRWMNSYQEAVEEAKNAEMERAHSKLARIAPLRKTVKEVFPDRPTYHISSWLIREAYSQVTELPEEAICFIAGQKLKDGYTLEKMLELEYERRTRGGAVGEVNSVAKALLAIDKYGASFTAHFHSHPFKGPEGTKPSGIDLNFQERLERGGHVCIGGIFSRSGFLRFFTRNNSFRVEVNGKGVKRYEGHLFQIKDG